MEENNIIIISAEESGERLDALLTHNIEGLSRNAAKRLIEDGAVTRGGAVLKKNYRCAAGDSFTVVLETDGKQQLIYKHAISTIVPPKSLDLELDT